MVLPSRTTSGGPSSNKHQRDLAAYYSPRGNSECVNEEDALALNNCDWLLESLIGLKLMSSYSKALKSDRLLVEAQCLASDMEQLINHPQSIDQIDAGSSTEAEFASDFIWNAWRASGRDGNGIERATEKVETDPSIPSCIYDWMVTRAEMGHIGRESLEDKVGSHPLQRPEGHHNRRASTPPVPSNLPADGWIDDSPSIHDMNIPRSQVVMPIENTMMIDSPEVESSAHDNATDTADRIRAELNARFEAAKLKRTLKIQQQQQQQQQTSHKLPIAELATTSMPSIHDASHDRTTTPVPARNTSQTPLMCHVGRSSGRMRMHRSLKKLPPKSFDESLFLSDDEANAFRDFDFQPANVTERPKKARWAVNKKDWENQVKRQQNIDPHSIFGYGSAPIEFTEVFKTPDFRRAAAEFARKQDPKCKNILTKEGREAYSKQWHEDKSHICISQTGISADQVKAYREQFQSKESVAHMVWDESWTACEENCSHNSALRQPWFQVGKGGNSSNRGPYRSPCHQASVQRSAETMPVGAAAAAHEDPPGQTGQSQPESLDKVNWLSKVWSYGTDKKPTDGRQPDGNSTPRLTGGLLKGISGSFALPAMREARD